MATEVSGKAFLGTIRAIKDERGADAVMRIVAAAGDDARATFAAPIRIMSWYPYAAYSAFLRAIAAEVGSDSDGDTYMRHLGGIAGVKDLGTIFRVYRMLASPERLIRACEKIWPSYYRNAGRMEAAEWRPERTVVRIHDFAEMEPVHCRLMEGWMIASLRNIGIRVSDDAREVRCMRGGDPCHEFVCTWQKSANP